MGVTQIGALISQVPRLASMSASCGLSYDRRPLRKSWDRTLSQLATLTPLVGSRLELAHESRCGSDDEIAQFHSLWCTTRDFDYVNCLTRILLGGQRTIGDEPAGTLW